MKYIPLTLTCSTEEYNAAIARANEKYAGLQHDLVVQNCHSHVCEVLNAVQYLGRTNWSTPSLVVHLCTSSTYVSASAVVRTYLVFGLLCLAVVGYLLVVLAFAVFAP